MIYLLNTWANDVLSVMGISCLVRFSLYFLFSRLTLVEIPRNLTAQIDETAPKIMLNVLRTTVFEGTVNAFNRKSFNPRSTLNVCFVGECGIDGGGLIRGRHRFMRLLLRENQAAGKSKTAESSLALVTVSE